MRSPLRCKIFRSSVLGKIKAILTKVLQAIGQIMHETMTVLPKLCHVESAVSTHESERLAMACQRIWNEMTVDLSE